MKRMFVGNLAADTSSGEIEELFSQYGTVRDVTLSVDVFTGKCRGFAFVNMEGHEARAAMAGLNGRFFKGKAIRVSEEKAKTKGGRRSFRR